MGKERSIFVGFDEGSTNEPFVHPYRDMRAHMVTHLGKVMHIGLMISHYSYINKE